MSPHPHWFGPPRQAWQSKNSESACRQCSIPAAHPPTVRVNQFAAAWSLLRLGKCSTRIGSCVYPSEGGGPNRWPSGSPSSAIHTKTQTSDVLAPRRACFQRPGRAASHSPCSSCGSHAHGLHVHHSVHTVMLRSVMGHCSIPQTVAPAAARAFAKATPGPKEGDNSLNRLYEVVRAQQPHEGCPLSPQQVELICNVIGMQRRHSSRPRCPCTGTP